jgi:hypothetical protein
MDLADQIVGRNGDDGKGSNPFPTMRMTPALSKPGDSEGRAILHGNGIGLLCSGSFDGSATQRSFQRERCSAASRRPRGRSSTAQRFRLWH